jgi:Ca-activated chloride channel family protein
MKRLLAVLAVSLAPAAFAQGMLLPTDTSLGPLGVKYQRVSAELVDGAAVTRVEQVFVNSSPRQLEAHYVFPLPKGAALQEFSLWINGKKTKGEVLEKQKATDIYEGIVRRLQDPGLLEYLDSDVFRARVFPVPANGEQRLELVFSQVLDFSAGLHRYHYPLGASARGAPRLTVKQDFTFSATLRSKTPLRSIYSPTHKLGVSRKSENEAVAGLELGPGTDISKDLDLFYTVSEKAIGLTFMPHRTNGDEPGFFVALIAPKTEAKADEVLAKRVTFVIDTSGSMMGERIKLAREALKYCLQRLNAKDEFNLVRFSTDVESLFEKPAMASEANVKKALDFVATLEAVGGTAIDEALQRGLKDSEGRGDKPHLMMFITDGNPTVGETTEGAIAQKAKTSNKGSRVFTFGVGEDLNARLLDRLADDGRGTSEFLRDGGEFEVRVSSFFDKVSSPVLAEVQLDLTAFGAYDVYPKKLPDLFKGTQLVVMGRYRTPKDGQVLLTGSVNGQRKVFEYRAEAAAESRSYEFVPRLWAIRKVGYLLDEIRLNGEKPELREEVVALGKKYGIVTPYTSYLVVEDQPLPLVNNRPPPPVSRPWGDEDGRRPMEKSSREGMGSLGGGSAFAPGARGAAMPSAPSRTAMPRDEEAESLAVFGSSAEPRKALDAAEGKAGVAVAKRVRAMKEEQGAPSGGEPVRVAAGRTFVYRSGGWMDSEAISGTPKTLKVKYLSEAYFALVRARPDLKAAFALGNRVVVVVGKDKSIVIDPDGGETQPEKVTAFLK